MTNSPGDADHDVGYGKPPKSTRFGKGRSGNPHGRPRGRHKLPPYEAVLGQTVTIREGGIERTVTAAEAFLLHMAKRGLQGDAAAARVMMTALEGAGGARQARDGPDYVVLNMVFVAAGSVNSALEPLRMARKLDRYRQTARMLLEPWLVEAALARLDDKRLTVREQEAVVGATRTPWKVAWPDWWQVGPRGQTGSKPKA